MKQIINRMELRFPSGSVNESFARGAVSAFVLCLDPLVTDLNDLKTAVSEAVTNAIVHGYRDTIGTVYITAVIYADGTVQVKVRDRGCGIPDIEKAMEPLFTTGGEERAGLGFAVMQSFCDSVRVISTWGLCARLCRVFSGVASNTTTSFKRAARVSSKPPHTLTPTAAISFPHTPCLSF